MSSKILAITLLLLSVSLCFLPSEGNSRYPTRKVPHPCCIKVSDANISNSVLGNTYKKQSARHPCVEAIILYTENGQACVDPKAPWVMGLISTMTQK